MKIRSLFIFSSKENRRFFLKAAALFLFVTGLCFSVMRQNQQAYTAVILDKMERLKTMDSPKLVLFGGSGVAFGLNAETLGQTFGMPALNMGLIGSLGDATYEELARTNVQPGDIYIFQYNSFSDRTDSFIAATGWASVENHVSLWPLLRREVNGRSVYPLAEMLDYLPAYLYSCFDHQANHTGNRDKGGVYSRNAFNEYGDLAVPRPETQLTQEEVQRYFGTGDSTAQPDIGKNKAERIRDLAKWFAERGAVMLLVAGPTPWGEYAADPAYYENCQRAYEESFGDMFISDIIRDRIEYRYFYDNQTHLTDEGAALRTQQLILDLQNWMNRQDAKA